MPTQPLYYCLTQGETVSVVAAAPYLGDNTTRYVVRNEKGREFIVKASELSDAPPRVLPLLPS